jgi:Xaa-Pro dipeptidase
MQRRHFLKTTAATAIAPLAVSSLLTAQAKAQETKKENPKVKEFRDRIKPISNNERDKRIDRARKLMEEKNIDILLFEGGTSLNYFTGVSWGRSERLFVMVLLKDGDPFYIAPKFEESRAAEQTKGSSLYTWEEHENPYKIIEKILREKNHLDGILGVEESTRSFVVENIQETMPALNILSGTPVTAGCRSVKSEHEIELMQIANDITKEVFTSAVTLLHEGMTEREFGSLISSLFSEFGVGGGALVLFGEASAYPHGTIKEHTLKEHQIVLIDGGCSVEGYSSDVTRTTVFGTPTEKMNNVWTIVQRAQEAALTTARPGVSGEYIDSVARKIISDGGYGPDYKYFTHRLGHGIGMEGHEWYYLVKGNKQLVQPNNIFSNEPGIYIPGEFGIRIEDEMLITEDGAKLLLSKPQSLEKIF